jgi:DeoR family transcriptional regulator of aga operon
MRRNERLAAIVDRVATAGHADVAGLAAELGVSAATVRRDLQALTRDQLVVRTHGGATATSADGIPVRIRVPPRHEAEKQHIGRAAAALVKDGSVVGMSGGTTTLEVARALAERHGITVVTNAINIAAELVGRNVGLVVIGGIVRHSYELVGPAAETMLSRYHFDVGFIGVDGLTEDGATTYDEMEAQTDLGILRRSRRRVVVTDSSKIGRMTFAKIAPLTEVTDLVTDSDADQALLDPLRRAGVKITVA